ncbi:MAG: hypothetical protein JRH12_24195 [Deltaproteobacteria bacterium]|jgi:hypothetical protein|nr:hypothetical protein [Deltaproteobacteria bacterium]MBW2483225.1 hypothetical protein [Deltaproteobacteria bacterium]
MAEKKSEPQTTGCPVGNFFEDLEKALGKKSPFFEHMLQSKLEFMKGIRSLLDTRIDHLEKMRSGKSGRKMTKIKVE